MTCYARGSAIFCQNGTFRRFLARKVGGPVEDQAAAADAVRRCCGVSSRRELNTDPNARAQWVALVREFNQWTAMCGV